MKIRLFIFTALAILTAACNQTKTVENNMFAVEMPAGYTLTGDEISVPDFSETAVISNNKGSVSLMAFPAGPDPEKLLYAQTFGGLNSALSNCTFGEIRPVSIGGLDGFAVQMEGLVSSQNAKGTIYTLPKGDYIFMVIAVGSNGAPDVTEDIIASITPKTDPRPVDEHNAALLESVVNLSRKSLPQYTDEVTVWSAIDIDKERKCLVMTMTVDGSSEDYDLDYTRKLLETEQRDYAINSFRENRSADYLVDIPARLGYDFEYLYKTADDGAVLGRLHISNTDINQ